MLPLILALALLCVIPVAFAQPAPDGRDSLVLRGRVVAAAGGTPLAGARAVVIVDSSVTVSAYSDRDGHFAVPVPPRGGWRLSVTKAGFAPVVQAAPAAGEPVAVRLVPGAAITGRVLDERGDPLPGATVRIRRVCPAACEADIALPAALSMETDDRGVYRLGSLPAGRYTVELAGSVAASRPDMAVAIPGAGATLVSPGATPAGGAAGAPAPGTMVEVDAGAEAVVHLARAEASRLPRLQASAGPSVRSLGAIIRGRVLSDSGRPVAGTGVQATSLDGTVRTGTTDAEGRYEIFGLAAGSYRLTVNRAGLAQVAYGQQRARQPGTLVSLAAGEVLDGLDVRLPHSGVVTGRVVDAFGEPLEGLSVQAWEQRVTAGGVVLTLATRGVTSARTDDRGHYRVHGLLPGTYYVSATDTGGTALMPEIVAALDRSQFPMERGVVSTAGSLPARSSARIFHPAAVMPALAAAVRIEPGRDAQGVDITFAPEPAARVEGFALDSTGAPARGTVRLAVSHRSGGPVPPARSATLGAGGAFAFDDVPAGEYVLHVVTEIDVLTAGVALTEQLLAQAQAATNEFGMTYVTVTGEAPVVVAVRTGPRALVRARVVAEGNRGEVDAWGFDIGLEPADLDGAPEPVTFRRLGEDPWTFERQNVTGPMRFQLRRAPPGWYLHSAFVGGVDAAAYPFTFTGDGEPVQAELVVARGGDIAGRVIDARDRPVADYFVVAFTTDPTRWYVGSRHVAIARAGRDGAFAVSGLPPGDYWVVALDQMSGDDTSLEWQRSDLLNRLTAGARGARVTEGQRVPIELRLLPGAGL